MSWKNFAIAALCAMVAAPALADPTIVAPAPTLNGSGQWVWSIRANPDEALFNPNPDTPGGPVGGSLAVELAITSTGVQSAARNATNFPADNPGVAPAGFPTADGVNRTGNNVSAFLGSTFLTNNGNDTATAPEVLSLVVSGPAVTGSPVLGNSSTTTVNVAGAYAANGTVGGNLARVAQDGTNFQTSATFSRKVFGGDANLSGGNTPVTIGDLTILATNINDAGTFTWAQGDFNGSGTVTIADLSILAANINRDLSGFGSAAGASATVPEPASIALAGLAALAGLGLIRRKK